MTLKNLDDIISDISPMDTPFKDRLEIKTPYENLSPKQRADKLLKDADHQGKVERGEALPKEVVTISGGLSFNNYTTTS